MRAKSLKGERTRQRILETAAGLLQTKGFHGMSVDDILAESKTGKSQFYHYFISKEALVSEIIEIFEREKPLDLPKSSDAFKNSIYGLFNSLKFKTLNEFFFWLDQFPNEFQNGCYRYGCPLGALGSEISSQNENIRCLLQETFQNWIEDLTAQLSLLKKTAQLPSHLCPEQTAVLVISSLQGSLILGKTIKSVLPIKSTIAAIKQHFLTSVKNDTKHRRPKQLPLLSFAP
jgi:TetR/AcrR family transcriptional repressor of nem operon